jgi:hypothetical protein
MSRHRNRGCLPRSSRTGWMARATGLRRARGAFHGEQVRGSGDEDLWCKLARRVTSDAGGRGGGERARAPGTPGVDGISFTVRAVGHLGRRIAFARPRSQDQVKANRIPPHALLALWGLPSSRILPSGILAPGPRRGVRSSSCI